MNNVNYISLNDHMESPPPGVWDAVCASLDRIEASEKRFRQLSDFEAPVDGGGIWPALSQLLDKDEKATHPVKNIANATKKSDTSPNKPSVLFNRTIVYTAAAAVLAAGVFLFFQSNRKAKNNHIAITPKPSVPQKASDLPVITDTSVLVAEENISEPEDSNRPVKTRGNTAPAGEVNINIFDIEEEEQFFLTLANFVLPQNAAIGQKIKVKVDQFSSLYISTKLSAFMKGLYETEGEKNKPTRTARRNYRKLRAWKKACNKSFGERGKLSLSDPFVLAGFLDDHRKL